MKIKIWGSLALCIIGISLVCCMNDSTNPGHVYLNMQECFKAGKGMNSLDIITWNVHEVPGQDDEILAKFADMVTASGADILALQETGTSEDFSRLLQAIPEYDGIIDGQPEQSPAFLVRKNSGLRLIDFESLFEDDNYSFPRPPLVITLASAGNDTILLINIHLKCCQGLENENRRKAALEKLKYFTDSFMISYKVIILGDFNEGITGYSGESVFQSFLRDSIGYMFADLSLASGPITDWSYPTWPGHIDHFILSNDWQGYNLSVDCLKPDQCDSSYFMTVSDHRPVLLKIMKKLSGN